MKIQLELTHKKAKVKNVLLKADTIIGRSTDCGLRIASNEVSRQHCKICIGEEVVTVRDLGSSNGTFVNGYQLDPDTDYEIAPDSELSLGGIKFIVRFSESATKAMQTDGLGSTVDLKPKIEDETADLAQDTLREDDAEEEMSFAEAEETAPESEGSDADSVEGIDTTQVARPPELDQVVEETEFEMSTHGDSAILQHEVESETGEAEEAVDSEVGEAEQAVETEPVEAKAEEPAVETESAEFDLEFDDDSATVAEPDEAEVVDLEIEESAEPDEQESTPPVAKPVEPQPQPAEEQTPDTKAEEPAFPAPAEDELAEDDVAAFLNQVSDEEDAGDNDDESLGDFFKQFG